MEQEKLPKHIAIIMDGNRRWAKEKGLDYRLGHKEGAETLRKIAKYANKIGVKYLTVYAFSTENWKRTKEEVGALMILLQKYLEEFLTSNDFENIKLRNVVFSFTKDSTKIKIPEFILNKGDKISIVGESGQGKTTTMNILAGLYPLEKGELLVDDKLKKDCRMDLVFVSQEVELFDLSIRDNLCLGKEVPEGKIMQLLDEAGLMSWYKELPNGLETMVGEKGIKLSAGQKQRLNLIRGILIDKELYFFDEPTSNLDVVSEEKIVNMIEKYLNNKTYVIVTHRPKIKELCNRHYKFENHMMKELIRV